MSGKTAGNTGSDFLDFARENTVFVLVKPVYGGNIGSVARTMANMGFSRLVLVDPCDHQSDEARMMASGNNDILLRAEVYPTLDEALSTVSMAIATSRRMGRHRQITDTPDTAAGEAARHLRAEGRVAFVFGNEISGLSGNEFIRCQRAAYIPTTAAAPSMNLSHSVTVFAYEMRKVLLADDFSLLPEPERPPIRRQEMEIMYNYWKQLVDVLDLEKCTSIQVTMRRLRQVFDRSNLDMHELGMLRKIIKRAAGRLEHDNR